jgi:hypothetical protein
MCESSERFLPTFWEKVSAKQVAQKLHFDFLEKGIREASIREASIREASIREASIREASISEQKLFIYILTSNIII